MASLICWASGLLEVVKNADVPVPGPIVLLTGTNNKLHSMMVAHGQRLDTHGGQFYVPGAQAVPTEGREEQDIQQDRIELVKVFSKKLYVARAKQKGLKHAKGLGDAS